MGGAGSGLQVTLAANSAVQRPGLRCNGCGRPDHLAKSGTRVAKLKPSFPARRLSLHQGANVTKTRNETGKIH